MLKAELHDTMDLGRHGVIEASAGTGKTYAIESLFVRLLCEKDENLRAGIDEILVLTFTEKATGELQYRIRDKIRQKLGAPGAGLREQELLRRAFDGFDEASIFTIHGFCHRVLQQFPFETGQPFRLELTDDSAVYERMLRGIIRNDWPKKYAENLEDLLLLSGYTLDRWGKVVLDLASRWKPEAGDKLLPEEMKNLPGFLEECRRSMEPALAEIRKHVLEGDFLEKFDRIEYLKTFKQEVCSPLKAFLGAAVSGRSFLASFLALLMGISSRARFKKKGFLFLVDKNSAEVFPAGELETLCGKLDALLDAMPELPPHDSMTNHLAVETIKALKSRGREHKEQKGFLSYDDMLIRLEQALQQSYPLVRELRGQYKYALIDEFQDTDTVQWNILKKVFFEGDGQRLILVGDPKQAIFGFRGADVFTYLDAREQVLGDGREPERLETNWRSIPALTRALNGLFLPGSEARQRAGSDLQGHPRWFPSKEIQYVPAVPPSEDRINVKVIHDATGREAVTVMDLGAATAINKAARKAAAWIAREIRYLLEPLEENGDPKLVFQRKRDGDPCPLKPDDICVLVRAQKEVPILEEALRKEEVPHSYYRKAGLYQSDEAQHLRYLFDAIAYPANGQAFKKALLTPFFRMRVENLWKYEGLEPEHVIKRLFRSWNTLAGRRAWSRLFQSVLDDTGVLLVQDENTERRITNYQQILQTMEKEARQEHLDFIGVCERLNRYRQRSIEMDEDVDIHRLETEKPKVQIVTIHKSKGLQWPVVFLGVGSGYPTAYDHHKYHDEHGRTVYSLSGEGLAKEMGRAEMEGEDTRLYYVALTRAMFKLYVPKKCPSLTVNGNIRSTEGPIGRLLYPAMMGAWIKEDGESRVVSKFEGVGVEHHPPQVRGLSPGLPAGVGKQMETVYEAPDPPMPPDCRHLRNRSDLLCSFSTLAGTVGSGPEIFQEREISAEDRFSFTTEGASEKEPDEGVEDSAAATQTARTPFLSHIPAVGFPLGMLPRSAETGNVFHDILERINFNQVRRMDGWEGMLEPKTGIPELVRACMTRHGLKERPPEGGGSLPSYRNQIARIVWNTLHARFHIQGMEGRAFRLADFVNGVEVGYADDLRGDHRIHELEFLYPLPASLPGDIMGVPLAQWLEDHNMRLRADESRQGGYLTGFIDLVFRVWDETTRGWRYCILDWKSNWIPGNDYTHEAMEACMGEHNYFLQYELYSIALARWLKSAGILRSPGAEEFNRHFGGVFYFFLRGVDPDREGQGIYMPRGPIDPVRYEQKLLLLLNQEQERFSFRSSIQ